MDRVHLGAFRYSENLDSSSITVRIAQPPTNSIHSVCKLLY